MTQETKGHKHIEQAIKQSEGVTKRVQIVRCSTDGCESERAMPMNGKPRPPDVIFNCARNAGWIIDQRRGRHVCPNCQPQKEQTMAQKPLTIRPEITADTPPRVMSREDKRAIFRKIDECYDEKGLRYVDGSSDRSLGTELKMPWGWVSQVREESFGPAGPDPRIKKFGEKLDALDKEVDAAEKVAFSAAEKAELARAKIAELRVEIAQSLGAA